MRKIDSTLLVLAATTFFATACSDEGPSSCTGAACPGAPGAPAFSGVTSVSPDRTGKRVRVTWSPANDDKTPPEQLRYRVYVSTFAGRATSRPAVVTSEPGATSLYVAVAPAGATHYVVVRAVDADGNEDGNAFEKSVVATGDATPPTFAGARAVRSEPGAGVTVSWDAATDDRTAPEGMRYAVFGENASSSPLAVVDAKTEVTLRGVFAPGDKKLFFVRAIDAADNADANSAGVEGVVGPDVAPPTFAGCAAVDVLGSTLVQASWAAAVDDVPGQQTSYEIFAATSPGGQDYGVPVAKVVGSTSVVLRGLSPSTQYYFVCRARDAAGNLDANVVEKAALTRSNVTAPTFGGATAAFGADTRKVTLSWAPATDDVTPADKLVYAVYEARGTDPFDYASPRIVTAANATSVELVDLPSKTALRWVVRARDEDYNEDANVVESTGTTFTSFSLDVSPLLNHNCAVVGCHVAAVSAGGLSLSAYNAYASIYDVPSLQRTSLKRVAPGDSANSYLYQKMTLAPPAISFNPMPAPGTGNVLSAAEKDIVKTWIDQGAPQN